MSFEIRASIEKKHDSVLGLRDVRNILSQPQCNSILKCRYLQSLLSAAMAESFQALGLAGLGVDPLARILTSRQFQHNFCWSVPVEIHCILSPRIRQHSSIGAGAVLNCGLVRREIS